jgi:hypothetical protein
MRANLSTEQSDMIWLLEQLAAVTAEAARLREEVMVLQVDGSAYDRGYRRADDVARTRITELEQQLAALREVGQSLIDHAEQGRDEALEDRDEYKLVAKAATEYADVVLAQLAARDQQIAALREGLRQIICDLHEDGSPLPRMDKAVKRARALLAPPAVEQEPAVRERRLGGRMSERDQGIRAELERACRFVERGDTVSAVGTLQMVMDRLTADKPQPAHDQRTCIDCGVGIPEEYECGSCRECLVAYRNSLSARWPREIVEAGKADGQCPRCGCCSASEQPDQQQPGDAARQEEE